MNLRNFIKSFSQKRKDKYTLQSNVINIRHYKNNTILTAGGKRYKLPDGDISVEDGIIYINGKPIKQKLDNLLLCDNVTVNIYGNMVNSKITCNGNVNVQGFVKGSIKADNDIHIESNVDGNVASDCDTYIGGNVVGEIYTNGDVYYQKKRGNKYERRY